MKKGKIISSFVAICFTASCFPFSGAAAYNVSDVRLVNNVSDGYSLGDLNGDKRIDASDASAILVEYSSVSVGGASELNAEQKKAADVDKNGKIDAGDASIILAYYSYVATGGNDSLEVFMNGDTPQTTTTKATTATTTKATTSTTSAATTATTTKATTLTTSAATTATTTKATASTTSAATSTTTTKATTSTTSATTTATTATTAPDPDRVSEILLNQNVCNINVGESGWAAFVTMLPKTAKNVGEIWESSDEKVAVTTQDGWITGIGEGTCIITVRSADNPDVYAEVTVNVTDTSTVKEIRLDRKSAVIKVGYGELAANVEMFPKTATDKREIWESSDESIASVDDIGWVTAHKAGACTITVKSANNPSVFQVITILVVDDSVATSTAQTTSLTTTTTTTTVTSSTTTSATTTATTSTTTATTTTEISDDKITSISLSKYSITVPVGGKDISIVTMLPDSVENKEEIWISSDSKIASVDSYGWIMGRSVGECEVTVYSVSNPAVSATIKVKVVDESEYNGEPTLSSYIVDELSTDRSIALYTPFPKKATGEYEIEYLITDSNGVTKTQKSVVIFPEQINSVTTRVFSDTNDFTLSMYLINVRTGGKARIGEYNCSLSPRDVRTGIEDIRFAFYILGGLDE